MIDFCGNLFNAISAHFHGEAFEYIVGLKHQSEFVKSHKKEEGGTFMTYLFSVNSVFFVCVFFLN